MKVRKWMEKSLILILLALGLLFLLRFPEEDPAREAFALMGNGRSGDRYMNTLENTDSLTDRDNIDVDMGIQGTENMTDMSSENMTDLHTKEAVDLFARNTVDLSLWEKTLRANDAEETPDMEKKVALTFDDGPHPQYTEKLLDGLKKRNVHASFFVTGANAEKYPEILKRMQADAGVIISIT